MQDFKRFVLLHCMLLEARHLDLNGVENLSIAFGQLPIANFTILIYNYNTRHDILDLRIADIIHSDLGIVHIIVKCNVSYRLSGISYCNLSVIYNIRRIKPYMNTCWCSHCLFKVPKIINI